MDSPAFVEVVVVAEGREADVLVFQVTETLALHVPTNIDDELLEALIEAICAC